MRLTSSALLFVATALALGGTARATVMMPLDLPALVERSDRVLLGTVESMTSRWTDDHDAIYTEVTIRVSRPYKGGLKPGDTVVVQREGGAVDGVGMRVFGAAAFAIGEEAVLFVEHRGPGSYVVGMSQGKMHVSTLADGTKLVARNLSGVAFLKPQAATTPRTLEALEQQIRSLVR